MLTRHLDRRTDRQTGWSLYASKKTGDEIKFVNSNKSKYNKYVPEVKKTTDQIWISILLQNLEDEKVLRYINWNEHIPNNCNIVVFILQFGKTKQKKGEHSYQCITKMYRVILRTNSEYELYRNNQVLSNEGKVSWF